MYKSENNKEVPEISVIITCYNDGQFLDEAVSSVLLSEFKNFELIVIDDASSDPFTIKELNKIKDKGFQVYSKDCNKGVSDSRNTGIKMARAPYVIPLDADDKIFPEYLGQAVNALNQGYDVVYCNTKRFGAENTELKYREFSLPHLLASNFITSCSAFRKSMWEKAGGYDTAAPNLEDWDFWISMAEAGASFKHLDETLFEYRAREGSRSSDCQKAGSEHPAVSFIRQKHAALFSRYYVRILFIKLFNNIKSGKIFQKILPR